MASWMVHFRIADKLLDYLEIDAVKFIVGNIGPDCGEPNEDWSAFSPPTEVSHWILEKDMTGTENQQISDKKCRIDSDGFYRRYLEQKPSSDKHAFYLGYYIHLITDVLWRKKIYVPTLDKYREQFLANPNFIWTVKEDWYDLDHKYLRDHPDFRSFRLFESVKSFPNEYFDYYSLTAIEKRIGYISGFYNGEQNHNLEREYPYLTEAEMDEFVTEAVLDIIEDLCIKGIL